MVQTRERLPLKTNQTTMPASDDLVLPLEVKAQLTTQKLQSALDCSDDSSTPSVDALDTQQWLTNVSERIGKPTPLLAQALFMVKSFHKDQSRRSGVFATGVGMADILAYLYPDEVALVAAMLYRATRKGLIGLQQIEQSFGIEVGKLVKDALAMGQLADNIEQNRRLEDYFTNNEREQLGAIYNMIISTTNDVRAVLIKLAERTFAMRELKFASEDRKRRVAQEVMTIYAPLAHRLGIAQLKWELEDLAFRYLEPAEYKHIATLLSEKRSEREAYIVRVQDTLKQALSQAGITGEVSGRVKHIYSIWRKMKKKNLSFHQLYDIRALRVLVNTNAECYYTLGIVHGLWRHIPEQFDDYITNPKPNGYKSLHTAVIAEKRTLEVQIRTMEMHFEAELGMCAHVNYKEGGKQKQDGFLNQKLSSLRQLLAGDAPEDTEDLADDQIYVFSRDGDIIELPKGATVLDFAYHVHTEVGNRAQGARVNGRFVPLTHQPKTGEQVEIITKQSREPNRDWLIPALGYITTNRAKGKLRGWFNKQDRDKNIETGKQMLLRELGRLGIEDFDLNELVAAFDQKSSDELYLSLVMGELGLTQVAQRLQDKMPKDNAVAIHPKPTPSSSKYKIVLDGLDNVELHLAKCCNPVHGEAIGGFITASSGVSIHTKACPEYQKLIEEHPKRAIRASWQGRALDGQGGRYQPVSIVVQAYDRRGLLRDLTALLDKEKVNIYQAQTLSTDDSIAHMKFAIEVAGLEHLSRLLAKIESQPSVIHARRATF